MTAKQDFHNWLSQHLGDISTAPSLYVSEIADAAERFFAPKFSVQIQRVDLPDMEIPGEHTKGDRKRLLSLQERVERCMSDGAWRTLQELSDATGGLPTSVYQRLSQAQNSGRWKKEKRRRGPGLYEYRLLRVDSLSLAA